MPFVDHRVCGEARLGAQLLQRTELQELAPWKEARCHMAWDSGFFCTHFFESQGNIFYFEGKDLALCKPNKRCLWFKCNLDAWPWLPHTVELRSGIPLYLGKVAHAGLHKATLGHKDVRVEQFLLLLFSSGSRAFLPFPQWHAIRLICQCLCKCASVI